MSVTLLLGLVLAFPGAADWTPQNGDKKGEEQPALDRQWPLPPSPPLSVEEQLATFRLPEGYVIEAVATEPLVGDPVDVAWDARGRMWVVEMTSLMRDADGSDELEPDCSIVILSDTDGDGTYDKRDVFLEDLVLPRSVCFVPDGVLVILPPDIVFLQDLDGDGKPDRSEVVAEGLEAGLSNPEHAANSLTLAMDNWVYAANHGWRYRRIDGEWQREKSARIGQWGMSEDDAGRMAVNYNSSAVHVSVVPLAAAVRNEAYGTAMGTNMRTTGDTTVYPSRVNPGVNRGYRKGTLRDDGRLARLTGACGPAWFTGTALDDADRGRLFSCEPCANLVQRFDVAWKDGLPKASVVRNEDGLDFLTSTDERFRPVNLRVGPDGALYVVDLYRGILQHKVFLTSFLRRQAEERELVKPTGLGRIWRIRKEGATSAGPVDLEELSSAELIEELGHPNKWQRMTAQRLLVQRGADADTDAELKKDVDAPSPNLASTHALWTLEGRGVALEDDFLQGLPRALWSSAQNLYAANGAASPKTQSYLAVIGASRGTWESVRASLILGHEPSIALNILDEKERLALIEDPIAVGAFFSNPVDLKWMTVRSPIVGMFFEVEPNEARLKFGREVGRMLIRQQSEEQVRDFLNFLNAGIPPWFCDAMLEGAVAALPKEPEPENLRFFGPEPMHWASYRELERNPELVAELDRHLQWESELSIEPATEGSILPLHLQRGVGVYTRSCGTCHQPDGSGMAGLAPPFVNSEWLDLSDRRLIDIALNGIDGPIEVAGESWDLAMPGWPTLSDQEIADVLSYIHFRWASKPKTFQADMVKDVRANGLGEEPEEDED